MSEHGQCPNCGTNFDGDLIFEHFLKEYDGDRDKALATAEMYGATETKGRWGKKIGLYDRDKDRTVAWLCQDCGHQWERT